MKDIHVKNSDDLVFQDLFKINFDDFVSKKTVKHKDSIVNNNILINNTSNEINFDSNNKEKFMLQNYKFNANKSSLRNIKESLKYKGIQIDKKGLSNPADCCVSCT